VAVSGYLTTGDAFPPEAAARARVSEEDMATLSLRTPHHELYTGSAKTNRGSIIATTGRTQRRRDAETQRSGGKKKSRALSFFSPRLCVSA
jgi:hypothetical protein